MTSLQEAKANRVKDYLKFLAWVLPLVLLTIFAHSFLVPKIDWMIEKAGIRQPAVADRSRVVSYAYHHWVVLSGQIKIHLGVIFPVVGIMFTLLEIYSEVWRRFRSPILQILAYLYNAFLLFGITLLAVIASLAAPLLS